MNPDDAEQVRRKLLQLLADIERMQNSTEADRRPIELDQTAVGRLSRMDALQMQAMAAASQKMRETKRRRIGEAIRRIDAGEYGWCVKCGAAIAPERLATDLAIAACIRCAAGPR